MADEPDAGGSAPKVEFAHDPGLASAKLFFDEIVEPTVDEFLADPSNRRRGCLAALAVAAMSEHFFHASSTIAAEKMSLAAFKGSLRKDNPIIGLIADAANGTKHVSRQAKSGELSIGYEDIQSVQMNAVGIYRVGWPLGGMEVLIGQDRGWRLSELLQHAKNYWRLKLPAA